MTTEIVKQFTKVDAHDFPHFDNCRTILERALWVLWVAKDKVSLRKLTAEQIALVLRDVKEVSIEAQSITQALKRAGDKIHSYRENSEFLYEIMKAGKDFLMSLKGIGALEVFYFEPEHRYSSKRLLATGILGVLTGEIRIVDPYCGERTLDVIKGIKGRPIKFMTRLGNISNPSVRNRFLRELQDFKTENVDIEFRDYPNKDLHDRYIITPTFFVLLGHSIKDLGARESFAIVLNESSSKNLYEALTENFDRRWKQSGII